MVREINYKGGYFYENYKKDCFSDTYDVYASVNSSCIKLCSKKKVKSRLFHLTMQETILTQKLPRTLMQSMHTPLMI